MRPAFVSALPLLSASQISTFRECKRKWAWRAIAKIPSIQTASQKLGTEVDDEQLQPYLRDGREFDYTRDSGYIAASALEFLPAPRSPGLEVQKHFVLPSPASKGSFAYQGYMDLWLPKKPEVTDFKTTSDLKWAKSEKALSKDVQAMLYAVDALYETGADAVDLRWIYMQTRGPRRAKRVSLRVVSEQALEEFKGIEETALEVFEAKQTVTDVLTLPPSLDQCEAYGGCPYRALCNTGPRDSESWGARELALVENQGVVGMSKLLESLKARKAGAQSSVANAAGASDQGSAGSIPAVAAAPSPPAPLGINPPEKDLPPPEPKASRRTRGDYPKQRPLPFDVKPEAIDQLADCIIDRLIARLAKAGK